MAIRLRKTMLVLSTTLLTMQLFLMPIGMGYAESIIDSEEQAQVEIPSIKNHLEEQTSNPSFFFTRSHMQGTVEEPIQVTFFSDQEVSEARVFLPEEATLLKEQLPAGISVDQGEHSQEWVVHSKRARNTFVLPLVFDTAGKYEVNVEETTAHLEISEQEGSIDENQVEEAESSDEDLAEQEDLKTEEKVHGDQSTKDIISQSTVVVSNFSMFQAAIQNPNVTTISVANDIIAPDTAAIAISRTTSLTIEGNGHTINMQSRFISVPVANVSNRNTMVFNNINFIGTSVPAAIVQISVGARGNQWTAKFHNITTNSATRRLIFNTTGRVELSGTINLNTSYENIIASDVKIHDETMYTGRNSVNVSTVYFEFAVASNEIGYENNAFDIGKNAVVTLNTGGATYPPVYLNYRQLIVREDASFNVLFNQGTAVRLQQVGARMDVLRGANVNLSTNGNTATIAFSRSNTSINVEPGAKFIARNNNPSNNRPVVEMASNDLGTAPMNYTGNKFIINDPQELDIHNNGATTANPSGVVHVAYGNTANNEFKILNSDINIYKKGVFLAESYPATKEFTITGHGTGANIFTNPSFSYDILATNRINTYGLSFINHRLSILSNPITGGNPEASSASLKPGDTATLTANPNSGYRFVKWVVSGTGSSVDNPTDESAVFTMGSADTTVTAEYERIPGGAITIEYVNEELEEIADKEYLNGFLGDDYETTPKEIEGYSVKEIPENASGIFLLEEQTVTYIYMKEEIKEVSPVDPLDPEVEVDPENKPELPEDQRLLSIDFISSFNFGSQAISVHDQTYYAKPQRLLNEDGTVNESEERPNYVQISDRRSEKERNGWELAVTQKEQFKGEENQVLNGASLSLSNQQIITAQGGNAPGLQSIPCDLVPGNRRTLLKAQGNEGTGTWIYRFGDAETAGESVALNVPKGANPDETTYSTTLIWELSAVPGN